MWIIVVNRNQQSSAIFCIYLYHRICYYCIFKYASSALLLIICIERNCDATVSFYLEHECDCFGW